MQSRKSEQQTSDPFGLCTQTYNLMFKNAYQGNIKEKYHFKELLSVTGGFSRVYKSIDRKSKKKYAIKSIHKQKIQDFKRFTENVNLLMTIDHPKVIKIREIWEWNSVCFFVMDYCEGGDIFEYFIKHKKPEEQIRCAMGWVLEGLQYLHSKNIIHGDLKPENIRLKCNNDITTIKIIDYGFDDKFFYKETKPREKDLPSYYWPDKLQKTISLKNDIFNIGIMLFLLQSGMLPYPKNKNLYIVYDILDGECLQNYHEFQHIGNDCKDLIQGCINKEEDKRFTTQACLQHQYYKTSKINKKGKENFMSAMNKQLRDSQILIEQQDPEAVNSSRVLEKIRNKMTAFDLIQLLTFFKSKDKKETQMIESQLFVQGFQFMFKNQDIEKLSQELIQQENIYQIDYVQFLVNFANTNCYEKLNQASYTVAQLEAIFAEFNDGDDDSTIVDDDDTNILDIQMKQKLWVNKPKQSGEIMKKH